MLADFDGAADRRTQIELAIPLDVRTRVFLLGTHDEPEVLRSDLRISLEQIGFELANECKQGAFEKWNHPQLSHNNQEVQRMIQIVKPILFL